MKKSTSFVHEFQSVVKLFLLKWFCCMGWGCILFSFVMASTAVPPWHNPVIFQEWKARLLMEQSSAVKCPSISYHLVGTKKIQQELAKTNVLERWLSFLSTSGWLAGICILHSADAQLQYFLSLYSVDAWLQCFLRKQITIL
jgi:hypothetical protein